MAKAAREKDRQIGSFELMRFSDSEIAKMPSQPEMLDCDRCILIKSHSTPCGRGPPRKPTNFHGITL